MKRFLALALLSLLSACVTAQDQPPVTAGVAEPCPADGAEAWRLHLKAVIDPGIGDADRFRVCAALAGHEPAMASLGIQLVQWPLRAGDFEQGMGFLRRAAVAGDRSAQRLLAIKYVAGRTETGNGWVGRNAYQALFWEGVAKLDDPSYRQAPQTTAILGRYQELLSARTREALTRQIEDWRPGQPEPQSFTFDILMTSVLAGSKDQVVWSERRAANAVMDYGIDANLPDAALLALFRGYSLDDIGNLPDELLDGMVARGSFLALTLKLRNLKAGSARDGEEALLIVQLLTRLGLDIRYLTPRHDALLSRFSETGDVDQLMRAIVAASRPERQILATIAAMNACSADHDGRCDPTLAKLEPLITPVALNFLVFIRSMEDCRNPAQKLSCLMGNGGLTALRDIIVNDTVDLGGRSV